jgi:hypothetical protein
MSSRLAQLKTAAETDLKHCNLLTTVPAALVVLGVFAWIASMSFNSMSMEPGTLQVWVFFWTAALVVFGYLVVLALLSRNSSLFKTSYREILSLLHFTDLPLLIAGDDYLVRIQEETQDHPLIKWLDSGTPVTFEDRLRFAADYSLALSRFARGTEFDKTQLRDGSCQHFSGSRQAKVLHWLSGALCAVNPLNPCCLPLTGYVVFALANRTIRRMGAICAVCDFFCGDYAAEVDYLTPPGPPASQQQSNPDWNILARQPADVSQILRDAARSEPESTDRLVEFDPENNRPGAGQRPL